MGFSAYEHLLVERHGPVGWLINNRPEVLNAMNAKMREEFADAWLELDADPEVKVIVLDAPTNSTPTPQSATAG